MAHDRDQHLLVWVTKGQGLALIDGSRRGIGTHNLLFALARHLFAIDLGLQGFAKALVLPSGAAVNLPSAPQHLRIRDVMAQSELTALLEAFSREQNAG